MPKIFVSRSQVIDRPRADVFETVRDFHQWPKWSPWLIADPGCKIDVEGHGYSWAGEVCGEGSMSVSDEVEDQRIDYDLQFLKPFKSQADVQMTFESQGEGTKFTWVMRSSLPFFLFWMKKSMEGFIGMDYERGLLMLKDLMETGEVPSHLDFRGQERCNGFSGVGKANESSFDEISEAMAADIEEVRKSHPDGEGFCVYHKWDIVNQKVKYLIGVKTEGTIDQVAEGLEPISVPEMDVYVVKHRGPYRHLGNAWSGGMMHGRSKQFKHSRKFPPFEVYEVEDDEDPVVKVCLPMK